MVEKIKMIAFVVILGSILTTALMVVDCYTEPMIAKNAALKVKRSVLAALSIPYNEETLDSVFGEHITALEVSGQKFYRNQDGDIAFKIEGSGLWGPISGVMAVKSDLETIKGLTIIHQEETPGLGGRIGEAAFLESFQSKKLVPAIRIVSPGKAKTENEVDGITGATLSCKAFERILQAESKRCLPLAGNIK
jgi:Na+-transporting NADH:ubiquinone oxidoreductase subunit C